MKKHSVKKYERASQSPLAHDQQQFTLLKARASSYSMPKELIELIAEHDTQILYYEDYVRLMLSTDVTSEAGDFINLRVVFDTRCELNSEQVISWRRQIAKVARQIADAEEIAQPGYDAIRTLGQQLAALDVDKQVCLTNHGEVPAIQVSVVNKADDTSGTWFGLTQKSPSSTEFEITSHPYVTTSKQKTRRNGGYSIGRPMRSDQDFRGSSIGLAL